MVSRPIGRGRMFGALGMQEILIILVVGIIVFGASKMPGIARSLGSGMKQFKRFKDGINGKFDIDDWVDDSNPGGDRTRPQYHDPGAYYNPSGPAGGNGPGYPGPGAPHGPYGAQGPSAPRNPYSPDHGESGDDDHDA